MKRTIMIGLIFAILIAGCEKDNDHEEPEGVLLSGKGASTDFVDFTFLSMDFFGMKWLTMIGFSASDTLIIMSLTGDQINVDQSIALADTGMVFIGGTFGSGRYVVANLNEGTNYVSGTITFTEWDLDFTEADLTRTISGKFSSGASLLAGAAGSGANPFQANISGKFEAPFSTGALMMDKVKTAIPRKLLLPK